MNRDRDQIWTFLWHYSRSGARQWPGILHQLWGPWSSRASSGTHFLHNQTHNMTFWELRNVPVVKTAQFTRRNQEGLLCIHLQPLLSPSNPGLATCGFGIRGLSVCVPVLPFLTVWSVAWNFVFICYMRSCCWHPRLFFSKHCLLASIDIYSFPRQSQSPLRW